MPEANDGKIATGPLRRKAEELLKKADRNESLEPREVSALIYELQVYQVELELQNEELRRAQQELELARDRYADLFDFAPLGYVYANANGLVLQANLAAAQLFGTTRDRLTDHNLASFFPVNSIPELGLFMRRIFASNDSQMVEVRLDKSGPERWVKLEGIRQGEYRCRIILQETTEQHREIEHREMLMAELDHRVKNTLGLVQSIARQTLARSNSMEVFKEAFEGRLKALAQLQRLLTQNRWSGGSLRSLIDSVALPYTSPVGPFLEVDGSDVYFNAAASQSFYLALHELSTNAAKYGAFSCAQGKVITKWHVVNDTLLFTWAEEHRCVVNRDSEPGFGQKLLELTIRYDLGGSINKEVREGGFYCEISLPLSEKVRLDYCPGAPTTSLSYRRSA